MNTLVSIYKSFFWINGLHYEFFGHAWLSCLSFLLIYICCMFIRTLTPLHMKISREIQCFEQKKQSFRCLIKLLCFCRYLCCPLFCYLCWCSVIPSKPYPTFIGVLLPQHRDYITWERLIKISYKPMLVPYIWNLVRMTRS